MEVSPLGGRLGINNKSISPCGASLETLLSLTFKGSLTPTLIDCFFPKYPIHSFFPFVFPVSSIIANQYAVNHTRARRLFVGS
jgi:hypothetical protein